jgi:hypothetical protein
LKPVPGKYNFQDPVLKIPITKKGLKEWLKRYSASLTNVRPRVQTPIPLPKKKKTQTGFNFNKNTFKL